MAVSILNNLASSQAQRRLSNSTRALATNFTRLSSGLRINSGADDASGLAVGALLKNDSRVYTQAVRNANDAISLFNIGEGAALQLGNIITRIRELAEQSANGVLSNTQRRALDNESRALISEYSRITATTEFNGLSLFNGSSKEVSIQLGYSRDSVTFALGAALAGAGAAVAVGDGTFGAGVAYSPVASTSPTGIELGDINGDGKLDAVVTSHAGATTGIEVMLNTGSGLGTASMVFSGNDVYDLKLADINGDNKLDIIASDMATARVDTFLGVGDGTFTVGMSYSVAGTNPIFMDIADLNGDGNVDVVVNTQLSGRVNVLLGTGSGTFSTADYAGAGWNMVLSDVNNDGRADILTPTGGGFNRLLNNGSGVFGAPTFFGGSEAVGMAAGDFNHDGWNDVVLGDSSGGNRFQVYFNDHAGGFTAGGIYTGGSNDQTYKAVDLNGDNNLDLVIAGRNTGGTFVMLGNSDGSFNTQQVLSTTGLHQDVAIGDISGDGALDIVSTQYGAQVWVFNANSVAGQGATTASLLSTIDLRTRQTALDSMDMAVQAAQNISREISNIGAAQSRLATAASNLTLQRENIDAAASRIFDVDVAEEAASLTRNQILQSIAAAVLSQANQAPALTLQLLQFKSGL